MSPPGVGALLAVEGLKLARRPSTWILAAVLAAYLVLVHLALAAALAAPEAEGFDRDAFLAPLRADALSFVGSLFAGTAALLAVVFAGELMGHEFAKGTVRTLLLGGAGRRALVLAKLAVLGLAALLLAALGAVVSVAGAWAFGLAAGEDLLAPAASAPGGVAGQAALRGLGLLASIGAWSVIAFAAALWTRRSGAAIGITLAGMIAGDTAVGLLASAGEWGVWAGRLLPNAAIQALGPGLEWADLAWVAPALAVYVAGFAVWAAARFERADVLAATKA